MGKTPFREGGLFFFFFWTPMPALRIRSGFSLAARIVGQRDPQTPGVSPAGCRRSLTGGPASDWSWRSILHRASVSFSASAF
jgi:hypothetical protein